MLKKQKILAAGVSTIWENKYVCADYYRYATDLCLLSILSQSYDIFIDRGIIALGHGREVVDGLNAKEKWFIFHLMANVQLHVSKQFDT